MGAMSRSATLKETGDKLRAGTRMANRWKGGASFAAWILCTGATGSCTVTIYGSTSEDAETSPGKMTVVATLSPTAAAAGNTVGAIAVSANVVEFWDYLWYEVTSSTNIAQVEITIAGAD